MEPYEITLHGHRVRYRAAGTGPLLVLLHGIAGSSSTWEEVGGWLERGHRVVAPDLLGHGESAKPRGDYSLGSYANLVRDLLGALGDERGKLARQRGGARGAGPATLVGHSLGGGVAMQFAYQFPERCERLVLVSSGGLGREVHRLLRSAALPGAEVVLPLLCSRVTRSAVGGATHWLGRLGLRAGPDLEEIWRGFVSLGDADTRRAFLDTVRGVIDVGGQRVCASDRLYLADELPILIVWGERDPLIPAAHGQAAHERLPDSRLEIFPGAGHFPHRDDPRRFVTLLSDFIATTKPARIAESRLRERLRGTRNPDQHRNTQRSAESAGLD
jgi:pimeloyl-ACP methyl ester carboxylesterase